MGVLFKQKMSSSLGEGLTKKEARLKVLKWFERTMTCRSCDSVMKPDQVSYRDRTYCNSCLS